MAKKVSEKKVSEAMRDLVCLRWQRTSKREKVAHARKMNEAKLAPPVKGGPYLSVIQVADALQLSPATVRTAIHDGKLPSVHMASTSGTPYWVKPGDVVKFAADRSKKKG